MLIILAMSIRQDVEWENERERERERERESETELTVEREKMKNIFEMMENKDSLIEPGARELQTIYQERNNEWGEIKEH